MKAGQLFWGLVFVTIGVLILAAKFDWFYIDLGYLSDFWPVLLILWGGLILAKKSVVKPFIAIVLGILTGLIIYGAVTRVTNFNFWNDKWDSNVEWRNDSQNFIADYDESVENAFLELSAGAGKIVVRKTTSDLINGYTRGDFARYKFDTRISGNKALIDLRMKDSSFRVFEDRIDNRLDIRLNENPIWDMDLKLGAASSILELEEFKIHELSLKTGATDIELRLGDKLERSDVKVEMGAANLEIFVPRNSGCQIRGEMFLSGKDFEGFRKVNNVYETNNFDESSNKIYIEIHGAVSNVEVKLY